MCEKCRKLETNIERHQRIMARFADDPQMVAGLTKLIKDAEAELGALHPQQQK